MRRFMISTKTKLNFNACVAIKSFKSCALSPPPANAIGDNVHERDRKGTTEIGYDMPEIPGSAQHMTSAASTLL